MFVMKKYLLLLFMVLTAITGMAQTMVDRCVEVIYFHGKRRCATCVAIEQYAREVVDKTFAHEKKKGEVRFKVIDTSTAEGKKLAKDYHVTWSSLYVNGMANGKEKRHDMTAFAFKHARNNTAAFKKGVSDKIRDLLK